MSYREFLNKLLIGGGSGSGGASSWDEITGKPSTFPPSAHTHAQADVAGLTDIAAKAHLHANKTTLDKLAEADGKLIFDGAEIGGGGTVDESRLLPDASNLTQADNGKVMQFKFTSAEAGVPLCCNCQTLAPGGNNQLINESGGATITMAGIELNQDVEGPFGGASVGGIYYNSMGDGGSMVIEPMPALDANGDLTLEYWLYPSRNRLYYCEVLNTRTSSGGSLAMLHFSENNLVFDNREIIPASAISSLAVTLGEWHHIAISKKNQITRLFIDGVKVGEGSAAWSFSSEAARWCFYAAANNDGNCRCGGFRFSRSALYEADFEVPTAPFEVSVGKEMVLDFMPEATASEAGAMSAADKAKLDKFDLSNLAVDDLLIGTATGLARITLTDLKAKLDALA